MRQRRLKAISHHAQRRQTRPGKPNPVFVEIIVRADRGSKRALKPYVDAAHDAVMKIANHEHVFCGAIGRRGVVTSRTVSRWMRKYGFYGKP